MAPPPATTTVLDGERKEEDSVFSLNHTNEHVRPEQQPKPYGAWRSWALFIIVITVLTWMKLNSVQQANWSEAGGDENEALTLLRIGTHGGPHPINTTIATTSSSLNTTSPIKAPVPQSSPPTQQPTHINTTTLAPRTASPTLIPISHSPTRYPTRYPTRGTPYPTIFTPYSPRLHIPFNTYTSLIPNTSSMYLTREQAQANLFKKVPSAPGYASCCGQSPIRADGFGSKLHVYSTVLHTAFAWNEPVCISDSNRTQHISSDVAKIMWFDMMGMIFQDPATCRKCFHDFPRRYFPRVRVRENATKWWSPEFLRHFRSLYRPPASVYGKLPIGFDPNCTNVVIHIRVTNEVDFSEGLEHRLLPQYDWLDLIRKHIRSIFHNPKFLIFSQTDAAHLTNFNEFLRDTHNDTTVMLDVPLPETFDALVRASVLVTAKSSLSFMAGILNPNVVYAAPDQIVTPPPWWITLNRNSEAIGVPDVAGWRFPTRHPTLSPIITRPTSQPLIRSHHPNITVTNAPVIVVPTNKPIAPPPTYFTVRMMNSKCDWDPAMQEPKRRKTVHSMTPHNLPYCVHKTFAYSIQIPERNASKFWYEQVLAQPLRGRDLFVLTWKEAPLMNRSNVAFFFYKPGSTWGEGRNFLYEQVQAREMEMQCLYPFLIFADGDTMFPAKQFEDMLVQFEPAVTAVPFPHQQRKFRGRGMQCAYYADMFLNAFHRTSVGYLLPYNLQDEAVTWYASGAYMMCIWRHLFPLHVWTLVDITGSNEQHANYPRSMKWTIEKHCVEFMLKWYPELLGSQTTVIGVDAVKNNPQCVATPVLQSKDGEFAGKRNYTQMLDRLVNGKLAMLNATARTILTSGNGDAIRSIMGLPPNGQDSYLVDQAKEDVPWQVCVKTLLEMEVVEG